MKKNKTTPRQMESEEDKEKRWAKNLKMAASFAKQAGLDKKAKCERKKIAQEELAAYRGY